MRWKLKAAVQNVVSLLPSPVSYATYYWIQRRFGRLGRFTPLPALAAGIETWKRIISAGYDPVDKVFLEVGTGRVPLVPLANWLMGARRTISIDVNPYVRPELVRESVQYLLEHEAQVRELFGARLREERWQALAALRAQPGFTLDEFMVLCQIQYIAPGDAAATGLPDECVDFHTSFAVFAFIPPDVLKAIITEGNRIVRPQGLFLHRIDYSDHFSHVDQSISAINFLQFSDAQWQRYAGNRYMYMNRLRHDDVLQLLQSSGHRIVADQPELDSRLRAVLREGKLRLDEQFKAKSEDVLATRQAWIASSKCA